MKLASSNAFNLAVEFAWVTGLTIKPLLMKAHNNAFILALEQGIVNKETIKHLISKAHANMSALKNITS